MARIPFFSRWNANRRIKKSTKALDKLDTKIKQAEDMIEAADRSRQNCCPDSIAMRDRVGQLRDRLHGACKRGGSSGDDDAGSEEAYDSMQEVEADHEACRREAGIVRKPKETSKPKWVECMKLKGYPVTKWIPALRIEDVPAKK